MRSFRPLFAAAALAAAAFAASPAAAQSEMDPEDRALLRSEVRAYLLEHPEVIMEAIEILEERRRVAAAEAETRVLAENAAAIFNDGHSWVGGNPEGDITVVEFLDYNCGYCKRAHDDVQTLIKTDPNLRYVVKEFPILGAGSRVASQAAMAAMLQQDGALYETYNDALMRHRGQHDEGSVYAIASDVGLDVARLRSDAQSATVKGWLDANYGVARQLRIEGTPTFIIGDAIVRGFIPLEQLRRTVAEARDDAG